VSVFVFGCAFRAALGVMEAQLKKHVMLGAGRDIELHPTDVFKVPVFLRAMEAVAGRRS